MIKKFDIGYEWQLSANDIQKIKAYLQANDLLLDCLEHAYVSNREKLLV